MPLWFETNAFGFNDCWRRANKPRTFRKDRDYWGFERIGNNGVFAVSSYRRGDMRPVMTRPFSEVVEETSEEMLCSLLSAWYVLEAPHEILVPFLPESAEALEEVLSERVGRQGR